MESLGQDQYRNRAAHKATDDDLITAIPICDPIQKNGTSTPNCGADGGDDSYSEVDMQRLLGDMSDHATSVTYTLSSTTKRLLQAESEIINLNRSLSILSNVLIANSVRFDQQSSEIRRQAAALDENAALTAKMKQDMLLQELGFKKQMKSMQKASMGQLTTVSSDLEASHATDLRQAKILLQQREDALADLELQHDLKSRIYTEHVKALAEKELTLKQDWTVDVKEFEEKLRFNSQLDFEHIFDMAKEAAESRYKSQLGVIQTDLVAAFAPQTEGSILLYRKYSKG
jgi:hypothetical protein